MLVQQRTISNKVSLSGVGLHTGCESTITFLPAPENHGIVFRRTDVGGKPEIPALADYVVDVSRGTTLGIGEVKVHTVEHVLAALAGLEIDNVMVELDAQEPPVGDGSAKPFVDALLNAGFTVQDAPKDYLIIDQTVEYLNEKKDVQMVALPLDDFRVTIMIDYKNPALGSQHTGLFSLEDEFVNEFSTARTFCFLKEVEMLRENGLIKGGNLENAIVIVDDEMDPVELRKLAKKLGVNGSIMLGSTGILNDRTLRYKNEPARHKLLDLLGDLALVGAPMKAQILAARPGHPHNVEFAKKIRKLYQQKKIVKKYQFTKTAGVIFDIEAIKRILPHRYPFLLVDKIVDFKMDERVVGVKNITSNEPFFQGHFPGKPVMPGVLIVEAMAQTGGILLLNGMENPDGKLVFFMSMNNVKFRKPVGPGDQLIMQVELASRRNKIATMSGKAFVDGTLVAEAEMTAAIVDVNNAPSEGK